MGFLEREKQVGSNVSKGTRTHDQGVVHSVEDGSCHNVPDDTCNDLWKQLNRNVEGVHVTDLLHEESKPEIGGEESHHSQDGGTEEL